ncbi:MAG: translation initiation factor IF-2 N-terminal domain-containing protein, partial [Candidatus Cloacimonetes bacterium]|nr:translation initiation factor IF-2 N-terminal domain-containing protein [Candidatus Cloacimonadota bacterium]
MSIKVCDLAMELKISNAALKKHLKDIGVVVKSHLSVIEDDAAETIRNKFIEQRTAIAQIDAARKLYFDKKKSRYENASKKVESPFKDSSRESDSVIPRNRTSAVKSSRIIPQNDVPAQLPAEPETKQNLTESISVKPEPVLPVKEKELPAPQSFVKAYEKEDNSQTESVENKPKEKNETPREDSAAASIPPRRSDRQSSDRPRRNERSSRFDNRYKEEGNLDQTAKPSFT